MDILHLFRKQMIKFYIAMVETPYIIILSIAIIGVLEAIQLQAGRELLLYAMLIIYLYDIKSLSSVN